MSIEQQLAEYFERQNELHPEIAPDEVSGSAVQATTSVPSKGSPWFAAVAAAAVLLLVGVASVFSISRPSGPPSTIAAVVEEEPITTTIVEPDEPVVTTTAAPPLFEYVEMTPLAVVAETTTVTNEFGVVTWTRYAADGAVPQGEILFEPGVGYLAYPQFNDADPNGADGVYEWRSDDAVTWQRRPLTEFVGYDSVSIQPGWESTESGLGLWAMASSGDLTNYFVESGHTWKPVTLDISSRPAGEGAEFSIIRLGPVTSGDVTLFASTGFDGPNSDRVGDLWIADQDGVLRWVPNPTPGNQFDYGVPILPMPNGGFVIHDELEEDHVTFWTSDDGASWTEVGTTEFPVEGQGGSTITAWPGGLRAYVQSETAPHYVMESVDAVTWHEAPASTPLGETPTTSFGYINYSFAGVDGELILAASRDGITWEQIEVPPDLAQPRISGDYHGGAAGNIYYLVIAAESGELHYWTGRFE